MNFVLKGLNEDLSFSILLTIRIIEKLIFTLREELSPFYMGTPICIYATCAQVNEVNLDALGKGRFIVRRLLFSYLSEGDRVASGSKKIVQKMAF